MEEDGDPLLQEDFDLNFDHDSSSINSSSKQNKLALLKVVTGIVLSVMRKYLFISSITVILIFIFFFIFGFLASSLLFICGFFAVFYNVSDELVYWPCFPPDSRSLVRLPSTIGLPSENLFLYAKDGTKLHAVFVKQDSSNMPFAPTFIYLHGNAGNIGHRLANIFDLYRIVGVNLLVVEYRGYGLSEGMPSETGFYLDAEAAVCYLKTRPDIDLNKIVLFGRSLGGAVAVDCVSRPEMRTRVSALIIENSFTSIPDMARTLFAKVKLLSSLPVWCHKNKFLSKLKMCRVVAPTLLLSGLSDTLVPPRMMTELYRSCASPSKRMFQFKRGSHNDTWRRPGYYQALGMFLEEVFQTKPRIANKRLPPGVISVSDTEVL